MKTFAQKITELLADGKPVRSVIMGCFGEIEKVTPDGFVCLKRRKYKRYSGGFHMTERLNHPRFALKEINGRWMLGNRKTWSQKIANGRTGLAAVFRDFGI